MTMEYIKDIPQKDMEELSRPTPCVIKGESTVWATLVIPIGFLRQDQIDNIVTAVNLLAKAGVTFDTGCGFGGFDLELNGETGFRGAFLLFHGFPQGFWRGMETVLKWYLQRWRYEVSSWLRRIKGRPVSLPIVGGSNAVC